MRPVKAALHRRVDVAFLIAVLVMLTMVRRPPQHALCSAVVPMKAKMN